MSDYPIMTPLTDKPDTELLIISKEDLDYLMRRTNFLSNLEACGVDSWEGYAQAREMGDDYEETDDDE